MVQTQFIQDRYKKGKRDLSIEPGSIPNLAEASGNLGTGLGWVDGKLLTETSGAGGFWPNNLTGFLLKKGHGHHLGGCWGMRNPISYQGSGVLAKTECYQEVH